MSISAREILDANPEYGLIGLEGDHKKIVFGNIQYLSYFFKGILTYKGVRQEGWTISSLGDLDEIIGKHKADLREKKIDSILNENRNDY